jgi:hypothetical protein
VGPAIFLLSFGPPPKTHLQSPNSESRTRLNPRLKTTVAQRYDTTSFMTTVEQLLSCDSRMHHDAITPAHHEQFNKTQCPVRSVFARWLSHIGVVYISFVVLCAANVYTSTSKSTAEVQTWYFCSSPMSSAVTSAYDQFQRSIR